MSKSQVLNAYKQTDQNYVNGIETPHGRIKILYETIIELTASVEIDDYETAERMTVIDRAGYTHDFKRFQEKIQIHNYNKK